MSKRKYDHYEVATNHWGEDTAHDWPAATSLYNHFRSLEDTLVTLYGVTEDGQYHKIRSNFTTKVLYIFHGSLSVLQILENEGIDKKVKRGMGQRDAFRVAQGVIKDHFERTGSSWEYDLDLDVEVFQGKDTRKLDMDAERSIDNFEATHDFEQFDGDGNAQGFTAFTL